MWLETVYSIKKEKSCSKTPFDFQVTRKKSFSLPVSSCFSLQADKPYPKLSDSTSVCIPNSKRRHHRLESVVLYTVLHMLLEQCHCFQETEVFKNPPPDLCLAPHLLAV